MTNIKPLKEQYRLKDELLTKRFNKILPQLMDEAEVDMWFVIAKEYNEDPVFSTIVPALMKTARRLTIFAFSLNEDQQLEAINFGKPFEELEHNFVMGWDGKNQTQFEAINEYVRARNPKKIGVNISEHVAVADGLTQTLYRAFNNGLEEPFRERLVSAEGLCVRWLESRLVEEIELYRTDIYNIATEIIERSFSKEVIQPGVTTTTDVEWFIMEEINKRGLEAWFTPDVDIQRKGVSNPRIQNEVIEYGDVIHCDVGLRYLGLCTDTQRMGYIAKRGQEIPKDLVKGFEEANRFQDIVSENFVLGRTGNEIMKTSLEQAKDEGITAMVYTHPIGYFGHGPGTTVGRFDRQDFVEHSGEHPLHDNTCYALELNTQKSITCWNNQVVWFMLEETVGFTCQGIKYFDEDRKRFKLITI